MVKYLIALILILLNRPSTAQPTITLRIDPDNSRGGTASQIFDSLEFIPLQTTNESLFGTVDQLEVTDSLFIILDVRSHSILLFYRNGKFYTKITTGGANKYFYYFTLDRSTGEIVATNNYANGLLVFDLQGKFLRKERCPDNVMSIYRFSDGLTLYNIRRSAHCISSAPTLYDLCYTKNYDSLVRNLKPYNAGNEDDEYNMISNPINFSGEDGSCMFSMPFDHTFYQFNDTGLIRKYHFIFPLIYSLPANFATDPAYCNLRGKYAYTTPGNESAITALERGYSVGEYLLFSTFSRRITSFNVGYNYAYNLRTGSLISFSRVTADSSSCYFPILSTPLELIGAVYRGNVFSSVPSFKLFVIKNSMDKKVTYSKSLQEYLSTGKRTDNAVIIQFKLKPGL